MALLPTVNGERRVVMYGGSETGKQTIKVRVIHS